MPFVFAELPSPSARGSCASSPMPSPMRSAGGINFFHSLRAYDPADSEDKPTGYQHFELPMKITSGWATPPSSNSSPCKFDRRGLLSPLRRAPTPVNRRAQSMSASLRATLAAEPCCLEECEEGVPQDVASSVVVEDTRCLATLPATDVASISCRTPSNGRSASSSSSAKPLPTSELDWLMGTLSADDLTRFRRRFFLSDCERRFRELDTDHAGVLDLEKLQDALFEMFPTLKLELRADGHHIPSWNKNLSSLIATFDTNSDGYLDFDDFVRFIKFQQAWRAQFYLSRTLPKSDVAVDIGARLGNVLSVGAAGGLRKSASLPSLGARRKPVGKRPRSKPLTKGLSKSALLDLEGKSGRSSRPSSRSSASTRCSSSSSLSSGTGPLDPSRGAFYSSSFSALKLGGMLAR